MEVTTTTLFVSLKEFKEKNLRRHWKSHKLRLASKRLVEQEQLFGLDPYECLQIMRGFGPLRCSRLLKLGETRARTESVKRFRRTFSSTATAPAPSAAELDIVLETPTDRFFKHNMHVALWQ
jgi:hypothetical protein